jgi:hypothetical protein
MLSAVSVVAAALAEHQPRVGLAELEAEELAGVVGLAGSGVAELVGRLATAPAEAARTP